MIPNTDRFGMTRKKVLHREMELTLLLLEYPAPHQEKIERSAEAFRVCQSPTTFPSEDNFATKPRQ